MILKCLGSSSQGNCYLLEAADETLIVEAGIPIRDIKKGLGWQLGKVVGCLISHRHEDHAKSLKDILAYGIRVLALSDVFDAGGLRTRVFCKEIEPMHGYKVGGFKVFVLPVVHDVPCAGFVIEHQEMGRLLFITDTMMFEYRLPNLNHVMIEANYSDAILQQNIDRGFMPPSMRSRLFSSHMELETTKEVLRTTDLSEANEVILLHLSDGNSNAQAFAEEAREIAGKPAYIACAGLEVNIDKIPY
nr:MAG TPA: YycJ-like MBL-fold protein [Caudoviricetes sp.]